MRIAVMADIHSNVFDYSGGKIRRKTVDLLKGYLCHPAVENGLADYIVPPGLGTDSGMTGAYLLARQAEESWEWSLESGEELWSEEWNVRAIFPEDCPGFNSCTYR